MVNLQFKKWLFLWIIILVAFPSFAQQDHFVYLQTDNGKPFYVRMNNKILSSSSEGYVILPNITNGVYQIKVGFPQNEYPEESFTVSVDNNNEGYLIKHFDEKGLQLFNMETLALISGDKDTTYKTVVTTKDNNTFTKMLANVVQDSTILQNHEVTIVSPPKPSDTTKNAGEITTSEINSDSSNAIALNNSSSSSPLPNTVDSNLANSNPKAFQDSEDSSEIKVPGSPVSKLLSKKNKEGLQMIYADRNGDGMDTVRVFMPSARQDARADSEATNNNNFDLAENKKIINSSPDTSQLTITPTKINTEPKKDGFVLRKDSLSSVTDSANVSKAKTAPEQVFYIGPKEKEKESAQEKTPEEKKGLFSAFSNSKGPDKDTGNNEKKPVNKIEVLPKVVNSSAVNSDCKAFADNEDFLRLRKKMASEDNKEAMIKVARKFFKSRCFSTAQIKDLSYLFLTDEGKYMFFDAAYPHTSDSDQYSSLEAQIKDPYYRSRFEAMVRQ